MLPTIEDYDYSKVKEVKSRMKKTYHYFTIDERREIMADCNEQALILLEYMMDTKDTSPITDESVARSLGWSKRKAQHTRLMLENKGYFYKEVFTTSTGKKLIRYYIGKKAVNASKPLEDEDGYREVVTDENGMPIETGEER